VTAKLALRYIYTYLNWDQDRLITNDCYNVPCLLSCHKVVNNVSSIGLQQQQQQQLGSLGTDAVAGQGSVRVDADLMRSYKSITSA